MLTRHVQITVDSKSIHINGEHDEAERIARELTKTQYIDPICETAGDRVLARILADRGALDEAERHARRACDVVFKTDSPVHRGWGLLALAHVLHAAEKTAEAREYADVAATLFKQKGHAVLTRRAADIRDRYTQSSPRADTPRL